MGEQQLAPNMYSSEILIQKVICQIQSKACCSKILPNPKYRFQQNFRSDNSTQIIKNIPSHISTPQIFSRADGYCRSIFEELDRG